MRKMWILTTAAAAGLMLANIGADRIGAADDAAPSIEDIMTKINKKNVGLHSDVGTALKAGTVDWDALAKKTKEYATLAAALGKNDPPKGSKMSWAKLTKAYADDATALNAAAEKKDKTVAAATLRKLQGQCMACHSAHRMN
jgi:cytochrome c556